MTTEQAEKLLVITEAQIEEYRDFMAGQHNFDMFENQLYNCHVAGYHEDSLVFGHKLLQILHWRKIKLERFLKGGDSDDGNAGINVVNGND